MACIYGSGKNLLASGVEQGTGCLVHDASRNWLAPGVGSRRNVSLARVWLASTGLARQGTGWLSYTMLPGTGWLPVLGKELAEAGSLL